MATSLKACLALLFPGVFAAIGCQNDKKPVEPDILTSLGFGSCNKQDMLTKHWPIISARNTEGWLWMGDAVYADGAAPKIRELAYQKVLSDKGYRALTSKSFIIGTWDDHDYAENDAGFDYEYKVESQKLFLDFVDEPDDSLRRTQSGLYSTKTIGKEDNQVQFLLLDMRYFKTKTELLGPAQWAWLETALALPGPAFRIVVTSIQALTDYTGKDSWACYPDELNRLLTALSTSPVQVLLLSGDRHLTEISAREVAKDRLVTEITSSGITHTTDHLNDNLWRVQPQLNVTNFGVLKFEWTTETPPKLKSVRSELYSPQTGELLREFEIPLKWG